MRPLPCLGNGYRGLGLNTRRSEPSLPRARALQPHTEPGPSSPKRNVGRRNSLEMKHATSRMLFSYWDSLRGERAAPERSDVEPGAIRHILADTFILGIDREAGATFRLAGTRCSALFGNDLKGRQIRSLWPEVTRSETDRHVATVTSETAALVAGLRGTADNGWLLDLELLLLPLRHRGRSDERALGAISPRILPSWVGLIPIVSLQTTSLRIVNIGREHKPAPLPVSPGVALARRRGLVLIEGGLSL